MNGKEAIKSNFETAAIHGRGIDGPLHTGHFTSQVLNLSTHLPKEP